MKASPIDRLHAHGAIQALAQGAGGLFIVVYLVRGGVPTPLVLLTMGAMNGGRFLIRPLVLPLAARLGLRRTVMLGACLEAVIFPLLPAAAHGGVALALAALAGAVSSVIYWTAYHAYYAALGDEAARGGQVGRRELMSAASSVLAPGLGGWALTTFGGAAAFGVVALVQCLSALPLSGAPEARVDLAARVSVRAALQGVLLFVGDGWIAGSAGYLWQIALFKTLGTGFGAYGGAMAVAGLAGAVGGVFLGRHVDQGRPLRSVAVGYGAVAAGMIFKAASVGSPALAVAANAVSAATGALAVPVLMARVYNLAKRSACPLRFHIATEAGWDLGSASGCALAALSLSLGATMAPTLLLGLLGVGLIVGLLVRGYLAPPLPGDGPGRTSAFET